MEIKRIFEINETLIYNLNQTFVKGSPDGKSGKWDLENTKKFVSNPDNIFLLAFQNESIAGMISAYVLPRMDDKKAEMFFYEIGVQKNFRQQGIGKALISELKKITIEKGIHEMFVLTNRSNTAAMKLYESTGGIPSEEIDEVMFTYTV